MDNIQANNQIPAAIRPYLNDVIANWKTQLVDLFDRLEVTTKEKIDEPGVCVKITFNNENIAEAINITFLENMFYKENSLCAHSLHSNKIILLINPTNEADVAWLISEMSTVCNELPNKLQDRMHKLIQRSETHSTRSTAQLAFFDTYEEDELTTELNNYFNALGNVSASEDKNKLLLKMATILDTNVERPSLNI